MAVTLRRYAASNIAANTTTTLYTVPAGKRAILRSIHQSTDVSSTRMGITLNGAGFVWDVNLTEYPSRVWPMSTVLNAGDVLAVNHSTTGAFTLIQVAEMDAANEGALAARYDVTTLTSTAKSSAAIPAGKRFRAREIVVCPHATTGNVNVYVGGVGHLLKVNTKAFEPVVASLDMSLNAGEAVTALQSAGSHHVFVSGVLEDA